jgi:hypothetical protein
VVVPKGQAIPDHRGFGRWVPVAEPEASAAGTERVGGFGRGTDRVFLRDISLSAEPARNAPGMTVMPPMRDADADHAMRDPQARADRAVFLERSQGG